MSCKNQKQLERYFSNFCVTPKEANKLCSSGCQVQCEESQNQSFKIESHGTERNPNEEKISTVSFFLHRLGRQIGLMDDFDIEIGPFVSVGTTRILRNQ